MRFDIFQVRSACLYACVCVCQTINKQVSQSVSQLDGQSIIERVL